MTFLIFLKSYPAEIHLHNLLLRVTLVYNNKVEVIYVTPIAYIHSDGYRSAPPWVTIGDTAHYTSQSTS